ncbi:MAG TPA: nucleotidyltransferase domain-containing protein [Polyangiaceae bacterium]|nr:nucleotidyltransferase domain-containing protein [Polyangiaceae bacterium]
MASTVARGTANAALARFASLVRSRLGGRVRRITLFGSYARGEANEESDLDVLIVVDDLSSAEGREIAHLAGDVLTEFGLLISAFTQSTESWRSLRDRERRIARDIEREGVPL